VLATGATVWVTVLTTGATVFVTGVVPWTGFATGAGACVAV